MRHFSWEQTLGHKQVHHDRLLVVTNSPYLSPNRHVSFNIPGLIGDVAELVAERRREGLNLPDLLATTVEISSGTHVSLK